MRPAENGREQLLNFGNGATAAHRRHHAVLPTRNAFAKFEHLFDAGGRDEDRAATVGDHVVILIHGDARHLNRLARVDLDYAVAGADHGDAASVDRIADRLAALDVAAQAVDH